MPFEHVKHGLVLPELDCETTDIGRVYWQTEEPDLRFPSITTVLSIHDKGGVEAWRARVGAKEADRVSKAATDRGTAVHLIAEDYLNNVPTWRENRPPAYLQSFLPVKRILDERMHNVWMQEIQLFSKRLKTAGRTDTIGVFDGLLSVVDFKTSTRPKAKHYIEKYFMQESFYAAAFFEQTGIPIKQLVTIITVDEGLPQVFIEKPMDWLPKFMKIRENYRALKGL